MDQKYFDMPLSLAVEQQASALFWHEVKTKRTVCASASRFQLGVDLLNEAIGIGLIRRLDFSVVFRGWTRGDHFLFALALIDQLRDAIADSHNHVSVRLHRGAI